MIQPTKPNAVGYSTHWPNCSTSAPVTSVKQISLYYNLFYILMFNIMTYISIREPP